MGRRRDMQRCNKRLAEYEQWYGWYSVPGGGETYLETWNGTRWVTGPWDGASVGVTANEWLAERA